MRVLHTHVMNGISSGLSLHREFFINSFVHGPNSVAIIMGHFDRDYDLNKGSEVL